MPHKTLALPVRHPVRYLWPFVVVAAALWLQLALNHAFGMVLPTFLMIYPAIIIVALLGGMGPGMVATVLAILGRTYQALPPFGHSAMSITTNIVSLIIFGVMGVFISLLVERYNRAQRRRGAVEAQARQAEVMRLSFDAIILARVDGSIESWNRGAELLYGYSAGEALGRDAHELLKTASAQSWPELRAQLQANSDWECELLQVTKGGDAIVVSARYQLLRDADGTERILQINRDVSERKRSEQILRESLDTLSDAQRIGNIGSYVLDAVAGRWTSSPVLDAIFGIDETYDRSVAGWIGLIHPEDRGMMKRYFAEEVADGGIPFNKEYRIIRAADGGERWVHGIGRLEFDGDGRLLKMPGVIRDITEQKRAELRLGVSEELYRSTFDQAAAGILHTTFDGRIMRCNERFSEIIGYTAEELQKLTFQQITLTEDLVGRDELLDSLLAGETEHVSWEKRYVRKGDIIIWGKVTVSILHDAEGRALHFIVMVEDVSDRKLAEARLARAQAEQRAAEEIYRTAFQLSPHLIVITRMRDREFIDVNQAYLDAFGYEREEVVGHSGLELNLWVDINVRAQMFESLCRDGHCMSIETQFRRKNGEAFWAQLWATLVEIGGETCAYGISQDISEAKHAENKIKHLAFFDSLTGLPNRSLLLDRLNQALAGSARSQKMLALLFIDLDNFKMLNDTHGHHIGDLQLREVASRLTASVRECDTVARLGGDEFVVLLEELSKVPQDAAAQAGAVGAKILRVLSEPYSLVGHEHRGTASIGVNVFGNRHETANDVLKQADIAMYQAKAAGRNAMRFFEPALQSAIDSRAVLEHELREAVRAGQFLLHYQPQVEAGRILGAEALLRWNHPVRGLVAPGEFITLAEETGLILPLGNWVLESACRQIAQWARRTETSRLVVAVNISARQFHQPDFVDQALATLERTGAPARLLKMELTESTLVDNIEEVITKMGKLKTHGVTFSVDDFGTGYSSLSYLKRLPLDQLKIDRSFVRDITQNAGSSAIASAIVSMSRAMGMSVIAEGVETEEQREHLARMGCTAFQGFLFSRPVAAEDLEQRMMPAAPAGVL